MKIVTRPDTVLTVQLREFKRKSGGKRGGRMELTRSKTITVHDIALEEVHSRIISALQDRQVESDRPQRRRR